MLNVYRNAVDMRPAMPTRRSFLQVGTLALGGITLADLLRAEESAGTSATKRNKAVIMIHLSGGPSHLDMYDMKPNAPVEYRGEFRPIPTNVSGIEISEIMPFQAKIADKFTILRGAQIANLHTGNMFYSGYAWQENPRASIPGEAQRPAVGSVASLLKHKIPDVPAYVSINNSFDWERAYYAGVEHEPFRLGGGAPREALENLGLRQEITSERFSGRHGLLEAFDQVRSEWDRAGAARGVDQFRDRAMDMLISPRARTAFDLRQEPVENRLRYADQDPVDQSGSTGHSLLLARRLVEAGVGVVTVGVHGWDTHANNFSTLRKLVPPLDQGLHALVTDLETRGMLQDVAIVMGGEFGRTPKIGDVTPDGRSHWPEAGFLWVAGGNFKLGQILGATDGRGERVIGAPIGMQSVLAGVYRHMGIDLATTIIDHNGRPQNILDQREVLPGLI